MTKMDRILIVKLGSIGDIIHTLPAVSALRASYPSAMIDWVVAGKLSHVLEGSPLIDHLIQINAAPGRKGQRNHSASRSFLKAVSDLTDWMIETKVWGSQFIYNSPSIDVYPWRMSQPNFPVNDSFLTILGDLRKSKYDVAIDFQGLVKSALITFASGARLRVGFSKRYLREWWAGLFYNKRVSPPSSSRHIISINNSLVEALGANVETYRFPIDVQESDRRYIHRQMEVHGIKDFVVINLGAGWPTKIWQAEKYKQLSERIYRTLGLKSVITVSKEEEYLLRKISNGGSDDHIIFFPTTLKQLIPLIQKAACFISGDTGPLHIAATTGTPIVGIYGPTLPQRNGPFNPLDTTIQKRDLLCLGCHKRKCPFGTTACMEISVEEVFQAVARRLGQK